MSLERMFATIDNLRSTASVEAAFGKPQEIKGKVLIPVANVSIGLGLGFGKGIAGGEEKPISQGESGGSGGGGGARPVAVIEVTETETVIRPIQDDAKIALAGIALVGWCAFWFLATLRAIFGKEH